MDTQCLSGFSLLLKEFMQLKPLDEEELTIFSIGSKGYYENPTTDMLAFFCDCNGKHHLGDIGLRALLNCLPPEYQKFDCSLIGTPEREVKTRMGKRIDLLLESDKWVIILENKIYHQQINPFDDYESFVLEDQNLTRFKDKRVIYVVLSPTGETIPSNWHGINYPSLVSEFKAQLAEQFLSYPMNKWTLLFREFILHLESIMSQPTVNQETLDFVLNNLTAIKDIQLTKQQAINEYHQQIQIKLQHRLGKDVTIRLNHWDGYPALRFALTMWEDTASDVVLFLSDIKGSTSISIYAELCDDYREDVADSFVLKDISGVERWLEKNAQYRGYRINVDSMNEDQIVECLADRLKELDGYEQNYWNLRR